MKDVELPEAMQEVMAMQAQAIREKRAHIIKAEAELEASKKLADAAQQMANNPVAVELRRMQMVTEVGAENNSTTVMMIPSDFVSLAKSFSDYLRDSARQVTRPTNHEDVLRRACDIFRTDSRSSSSMSLKQQRPIRRSGRRLSRRSPSRPWARQFTN